MNWRKMAEVKPEDGQCCLVKMKHGIIQGCYDKEIQQFYLYLWRDVDFYGTEWVPIEEANSNDAHATAISSLARHLAPIAAMLPASVQADIQRAIECAMEGE